MACSIRFTIDLSRVWHSITFWGSGSSSRTNVSFAESSCGFRPNSSRVEARCTPCPFNSSAAKHPSSRNRPSRRCSVRIFFDENCSASSAARRSTCLASGLSLRSTPGGLPRAELVDELASCPQPLARLVQPPTVNREIFGPAPYQP